jgi:hypothetical protein
MNEVTGAVRPKRNAILIHAKDGVAVHSFMPQSEANAQFDEIERNHAGGSVLTLDLDWDAEDFLKLSPDLRARVASAKSKLARDLKWKEVMDRHGVPPDRETRAKVSRVLQEIISATVGDALSGNHYQHEKAYS